MKFQKQLNGHDPENGIYGDCYRTCVAIVLGLDAISVPNFSEASNGDLATAALKDWLKQRGMGLFQSHYDGSTKFEDLLSQWHHMAEDVPIIATGQSTRASHCVVVLNGEVVCDPTTGKPANNPFVGPVDTNGELFWWAETLSPIATAPKGTYELIDVQEGE